MNNECSICHENLNNNKLIITTECNHTFHFDCLDSWRIATCPLCRRAISTSLERLIVTCVNNIKMLGYDYKKIPDIFLALCKIKPLIFEEFIIEFSLYYIYKYILIIFLKLVFIFSFYKDWKFQIFSIFLFILSNYNTRKKQYTIKSIFYFNRLLPFIINSLWNKYVYILYNNYSIYNIEYLRLVIYYIEDLLLVIEFFNIIYILYNNTIYNTIYKVLMANIVQV